MAKFEDQYINWLRTLLGQQQAQTGATRGMLVPQLQGLVSSEGYSPEEQSYIQQESLGGLESTFGSFRDRLKNRLARTRNAAGYGGAMTELARDESRAKSAATRSNLLGFAGEKQRRREVGVEGLSRLYGTDVGQMQNTLGQAGGIASVKLSKKSGFLDWLKTLGGIGTNVASVFATGGT